MNSSVSKTPASMERFRLLISCSDGPGIVAAVAQFLLEQNGNIVHSNQHSTDSGGGMFFMRVEFDLPDIAANLPEIEARFKPIAQRFSMRFRFNPASRRKRLAIFVSKEEHCLLELLWQQRSGDLAAEIAMVVSNHETLRRDTEAFGVPFYHVPVNSECRDEAERRHLELLKDRVDAVVLARYMQIIPSAFIAAWENRIINIHHSFLPAFVGAKPYHKAYERGVKLIGATAHYVTDELDAGPIIEQDVRRVDHQHAVPDMLRIGRQIERTVLARAVTWHVEDRILVHNNKTIVFL